MPFTRHPVFIEPEQNQIIWRFMDFVKFYDLVTRKTLYLPNLATLTNDPWEGLPPSRYFDPSREVTVNTVESNSTLDLREINESKIITQQEFFMGKEKFDLYVENSTKSFRKMKEKLFVNCWHMSECESEALWKIYGDRNYGICIRSTYNRLNSAISFQDTIYAGKIIYLDETTELQGDNNIFYNCMWKRKSFGHEKEFRILIHKQEISASGLRIPIDINCLIEEIIVDPQANDWFLEIVRELGKTVGCNNCNRSKLFSEPDYLSLECR